MTTFEQTEKFLKQHLDELNEKQLETFQWYLVQYRTKVCRHITKAELEKATREQTVDKLVEVYGEEEAVVTTVDILFQMKLNNLAMQLTQAQICRVTEDQPESTTTAEMQQLHEPESTTAEETEKDGERNVTQDLSCSICFSIFTDPVTLQCGHTFCRSCVNKHWEKKSYRTCALCQYVADTEPQTNYILKSMCKNYSERGWVEPSGGYRNDSYDDESYQTPSRDIKEKKEAFEKIKQVCDSSIEHIKVQNYNIEKKIKDNIAKLYTFLSTEEETRLAALTEEKTQKIHVMELIAELSRSTLSLSDIVKELEDLGADKSLIRKFKMQMERTQKALPDPQQLPQALINESKHVENLQVRVLESVLSNIKDDSDTPRLRRCTFL